MLRELEVKHFVSLSAGCASQVKSNQGTKASFIGIGLIKNALKNLKSET